MLKFDILLGSHSRFDWIKKPVSQKGLKRRGIAYFDKNNAWKNNRYRYRQVYRKPKAIKSLFDYE